MAPPNQNFIRESLKSSFSTLQKYFKLGKKEDVSEQKVIDILCYGAARESGLLKETPKIELDWYKQEGKYAPANPPGVANANAQ